MINRSYGGISLAESKNRFVGLEQRTEKNQKEKAHIARKAAECIRDGDAIFMDASSSVLNMIPYIKQERLTIITNSLRVADKLGHTGARIFLTGGLLHFFPGTPMWVRNLSEGILKIVMATTNNAPRITASRH